MIEYNLDQKVKSVYGKKKYFFDSVNALYERREWTLDAFKSGIFPIKETQQILQRLAIALAQVKAGNPYENLLTEITPIIY